MLHTWANATDGTGNAVRVVLFDYRKAFDLIDHAILATKVIQLSMLTFIKRCVIDFLIKQTATSKTSNKLYVGMDRCPLWLPAAGYQIKTLALHPDE